MLVHVHLTKSCVNIKCAITNQISYINKEMKRTSNKCIIMQQSAIRVEGGRGGGGGLGEMGWEMYGRMEREGVGSWRKTENYATLCNTLASKNYKEAGAKKREGIAIKGKGNGKFKAPCPPPPSDNGQANFAMSNEIPTTCMVTQNVYRCLQSQ